MKDRIRLVITMVLLFGQVTFAQKVDKSKLVVGIVIDQMRAEYLYRLQRQYFIKCVS